LGGVFEHQQEGHAVVALAADQLQRGDEHAGFGGDHFVEAADADGVVVVAVRREDGAVAHHVVGDDQRARARQPERPFEVFRVR
jgi:hypothetical protein